MCKEIYTANTQAHQDFTISLEHTPLQNQAFYYYRISDQNGVVKTGKLMREW